MIILVNLLVLAIQVFVLTVAFRYVGFTGGHLIEVTNGS